jgi:hypothetical protein
MAFRQTFSEFGVPAPFATPLAVLFALAELAVALLPAATTRWGALRALALLGLFRGWLEPCVMLDRYWRAFLEKPPPSRLKALLEWVFLGKGL